MGNMSYCRFENTARDLRDCLDAIQNNDLKEMSGYEMNGFLALVEVCKTIASIYEDFDADDLKTMITDLNNDY
jgi:hypothetical protein